MLQRLVLVTIALAAAVPAGAQPAVAVEGLAGVAAFVDDNPIGHSVFGAAARVQVGARHGVGPEVIYMRGPRFDRDWFFTFNYTFDFMPQGDGHPRRRVNPFLVAGGGYMRHQDQFSGRFSSGEGAFTAGGGARVWLTDRVYASGDVRMGWEPHIRINGGVGVRF